MPWPLDPKFRTAENAAILSFIEKTNPSAHSDIASVLHENAKYVPNVQWYCPKPQSYAYVVLHTDAFRIYAIAFGMSTLAWRLPKQGAAALASGARVHPEIGMDWFEFPPQSDLFLWCKKAYDDAVNI